MDKNVDCEQTETMDLSTKSKKGKVKRKPINKKKIFIIKNTLFISEDEIEHILKYYRPKFETIEEAVEAINETPDGCDRHIAAIMDWNRLALKKLGETENPDEIMKIYEHDCPPYTNEARYIALIKLYDLLKVKDYKNIDPDAYNKYMAEGKVLYKELMEK